MVPVDKQQLALKELFGAIASGDRSAAALLLAEDPALARLPARVGATRRWADSFFYEPIARYVYAGDTVLHIAAAAYARDAADWLVSNGAQVGARNRRGAEPLHYASDGFPGSRHWNPEAQFATIRFLVGAGADPNSRDSSGVAPLHRAVRTRCAAAVRALLVSGADVRLRNGSGSTALHLAVQDTGRGGSGSPQAREQQAQIVELLLSHGARPSDKNRSGRSVRDCAVSRWIQEWLRGA
jgi:hypothetical protein